MSPAWLKMLKSCLLQCGHGFALSENGRCTGKLERFTSLCWPLRAYFLTFSRNVSLCSSPPPDQDECTQFPSVCPSDRPVCTNTYGSYKCRAKRRCNQGFEPNDDGSACVGEWSWQSQSSWITKISRTKEVLPGNEMPKTAVINLFSSEGLDVIIFLWLCPLSAHHCLHD